MVVLYSYFSVFVLYNVFTLRCVCTVYCLFFPKCLRHVLYLCSNKYVYCVHYSMYDECNTSPTNIHTVGLTHREAKSFGSGVFLKVDFGYVNLTVLRALLPKSIILQHTFSCNCIIPLKKQHTDVCVKTHVLSHVQPRSNPHATFHVLTCMPHSTATQAWTHTANATTMQPRSPSTAFDPTGHCTASVWQPSCMRSSGTVAPSQESK